MDAAVILKLLLNKNVLKLIKLWFEENKSTNISLVVVDVIADVIVVVAVVVAAAAVKDNVLFNISLVLWTTAEPPAAIAVDAIVEIVAFSLVAPVDIVEFQILDILPTFDSIADPRNKLNTTTAMLYVSNSKIHI